MKIFSSLFIGLLLFASCSSESTETVAEQGEPVEETTPEPSQEEMATSTSKLISTIIDASSLNLQLDGEKKWLINQETYTQLMKIKQQIYIISGNMESYEVSSYNEMGSEFLEFVSAIPDLEDEKTNIEFQKVISATKDQCMFMLESNLQQSQISVINLSIIYEEVPKYFEPFDK